MRRGNTLWVLAPIAYAKATATPTRLQTDTPPSLSSESSRAQARSIINAKKKKNKRNGKKILSDRVQREHKRNAARPYVLQPNAARKPAAERRKGGGAELGWAEWEDVKCGHGYNMNGCGEHAIGSAAPPVSGQVYDVRGVWNIEENGCHTMDREFDCQQLLASNFNSKSNNEAKSPLKS